MALELGVEVGRTGFMHSISSFFTSFYYGLLSEPDSHLLPCSRSYLLVFSSASIFTKGELRYSFALFFFKLN
jgi:hypothetical protein